MDLLSIVLSQVDAINEACENGYDAAINFIDESLSIEFTCDARKSFLGARVAITLGGPNIWLNTRTGCVEGYWGNESYERKLDLDAERMMYDITEQLFDDII